MKHLPRVEYVRKPDQPAKGLGDLVQLVTDATGISWLTKRIAKARGKDCGCAARRDKLNKLAPFRGES